jgi:hypothetical protein
MATFHGFQQFFMINDSMMDGSGEIGIKELFYLLLLIEVFFTFSPAEGRPIRGW